MLSVVPPPSLSMNSPLAAVQPVVRPSAFVAAHAYYAPPASSARDGVYNNTPYAFLAEDAVETTTHMPLSRPTPYTAMQALGGQLRVGISAPFVAQLLGQATTVTEATNLAVMFHNDNLQARPQVMSGSALLNSNVLQEFADVKYKPSNAAKPAPAPVQPLDIAAQQAQQSQQNVQRAEVAHNSFVYIPPMQQSVQQSAETSPRRTANVDAKHKAPADSPVRESMARRDNIRVYLSGSLIKPQGVNAYIATFSRNLFALGDVQQQMLSPVINQEM